MCFDRKIVESVTYGLMIKNSRHQSIMSREFGITVSFLEFFFIFLSVMSVDPTIFIDVNRPPLCVTVFLLFVHAEEKVFFLGKGVF